MSEEPGEPDPHELDPFGFEGDAWMDHVQDALRPQPLGTLGDYEILGEVHRGGQGVVYRAVQPGTNRKVAIKRLVAGAFASPSAARRFEREVEAAAALRHPGIVTVYGMQVVDGCPIMAMEWVDGVAVTAWARPEGAPARPVPEVLRTFLRICDAVEHAHQHGILHRDLKPSNILVDGSGRPRVLDFGLAKVLRDDEERGDPTLSAGFVGTPAYASPEHVDGSVRQLDVRSDVYSLGVVLYEMLTGARPYDPDAGLRSYLDALDRERYPPPSSLRRGLGRELDAIVRRALAPRREGRYGSVGELALDLRRLLSGRPVLAVHPSALYETWKLALRHRAVFSLSLLLLGAALAFAWNATRQARALARERDAATVQEKKAVALLDFLVSDMLLAVKPATEGKSANVGQLLEVAAQRVSGRFVDQPDLDGRVRYYLARAHENLGEYTRAVELSRSALERMAAVPGVSHVDHGACELSLGRVLRKVGQLDEAESMFHAAERRLLSAEPIEYRLVSQVVAGLAGCASQRGDFALVREHCERGLTLVLEHLPDNFEERYEHRQGLAIAHAQLGQHDLARAAYEVLLAEVEQRFGAVDMRVADRLGRISDIDEAQGRLDDARQRSRRSLEISTQVLGDDHPSVAGALGDLAALMTAPDERAEAEAMLRRAIEITDRARGPGTVFALVHRTRLAQNVLEQGRPEEAIPVLRGAVTRFDAELGQGSPWSLRARRSLARALGAAGDHAESIEQWEAACSVAAQAPRIPLAVRVECQQGLIAALRAAGLREREREATAEYVMMLMEHDEVPVADVRTVIEGLIDDYRAAGDASGAAHWTETLARWSSERGGDD